MINRSIIALLWLVLAATNAFAIKVNLYQVELPVVSQTADARNEATRAAFEQVLIRLSGDPSVIKNPVIKENILKAGYYVQEYRYAQPTAYSSEYLIHIRFDGKDINRLLQRAGISYWGEKRPLILTFLTFKNAHGDLKIISDDINNDITSEIKLYRDRYGLPLILPAMDMEDLNQFSAEDIVEMMVANLKNAGKRYAPEAYLIGNIQQTFGGFDSQWQLIPNNSMKPWTWSVSERTTDKLIANVIGEVSLKLSNRHVIKTIDPADVWVKLEVSNIIERDELAQLMTYLKQINSVRDVQLSQVSIGSVKIAVLVRGSLDTFRQNAAAGQHLILKEEYTDANILLYEWVR